MTHPDPRRPDQFRRPVPYFGNDEDVPVAPDIEQEPTEDRPSSSTPLLGRSRSDLPLNAEAQTDPVSAYPLSVNEMRSQLFAIGISKSKDSIQRYCREGMLDCVKLGMFRRYFATEQSFAALVETLQSDVASSRGMQLHEGASVDGNPEELDPRATAFRTMQLHAVVPDHDSAKDNEPHPAALNSMQANTAAHGRSQQHEDSLVDDANSEKSGAKAAGRPAGDAGMVDFLKEQLRVKDVQIKVKDEQIAAMLERDRETNILIRGLQDRIGDAFGLLVSGRQSDEVSRPRVEKYGLDRHVEHKPSADVDVYDANGTSNDRKPEPRGDIRDKRDWQH